MKTTSFLVLLILANFITVTLYAQNYRVLQPERTTVYRKSSGLMLGMRIDSASHEGADTLFHLLKNLQMVGPECFHLDGPSWMGEKVRIKPNGDAVFYNLNNSPILIKTRSTLNDSWMCYTSSSLSFRATLSSTDQTDVLGNTDSVKVISLQAVNSNGQNIVHYINNLNIVLSKNFGLQSTLNFLQFPEVEFYFVFPGVDEMVLCGISNPTAGIQNLLWNEVNDHNPGDELHSVYLLSYYGYNRKSETISRLLSESQSQDSIFYEWEIKNKLTINSGGNLSITSSLDTTVSVITTYPDFDLLPGVTFNVDGSHYNISEMYSGEIGLKKAMGRIFGSITNPYWIDTCYIPTIDGGSVTSYHYYKGLGGPYFDNMEITDIERNKLVFYKKDGVEWGTPLEFTVNTTLKPLETEPELVSVFPNPAKNYVNMEFKGNTGEFRLQILDYSGKTISEYTLFGENNVLDLANLKEGVYMLRLMTANQYITKKLLKL
ncbi:MAG: T9SS type A sorting domain-containing protein [Lentimicrobium sp.]